MSNPTTMASKGRPPKDPALVLRDQYWALFLRAHSPGESYASLERTLLPHLRITQRGDGQGSSQPFSLSKVAMGHRGLSPHLGPPPLIVNRAEDLVAGAKGAFTSVLWSTLAQPWPLEGVKDQYAEVAPEVRSRLTDRHFSVMPKTRFGLRLLNSNGIRRVSRLRHRDALGLLLCYSPAVVGFSKQSLTASSYVFYALKRGCQSDPALMAIKDTLIKLINERFKIYNQTECGRETRLFVAPRHSLLTVGIRALIG